MTIPCSSRSWRRAALVVTASVAAVGAAFTAGCSDIGASPSEPAAIEFGVLPAPAIVLGDSLRDIDGRAAPVYAIVRNLRGDILTDAHVLYTYADASRDTALAVDPALGYVVSLKPLLATATTARLAARAGNSLQVIRTLIVTSRPDSADRNGATAIDTLRVATPDTGAIALANTSQPLSVTVRHVEGTTVSPVNAWLVKYELLQPANPDNDTTRSVFLVDEASKPSIIDTTDASGGVARYIRVRAATFPATTAVDSAIVRVTVTYRGLSVKGAPIRIVVPVLQRPRS